MTLLVLFTDSSCASCALDILTKVSLEWSNANFSLLAGLPECTTQHCFVYISVQDPPHFWGRQGPRNIIGDTVPHLRWLWPWPLTSTIGTWWPWPLMFHPVFRQGKFFSIEFPIPSHAGVQIIYPSSCNRNDKTEFRFSDLQLFY